MRAVNYPATGLAPPVEAHEQPGLIEPLEQPEQHRPYRRILTIGGFALMLIAAGFLGGRLLVGPPAAPARPEPGLEGFAEMYVSTVLTRAGKGAQEVLVPYLGDSPDLGGLEAGAWYVTQAAVWSVEGSSADGWTVLVAADQLGRQEGGYGPAGTFFYEVDIEQTSAGWQARALPRLVPPPGPTPNPTREQPDVEGLLADSVAGFLTARFTESETTPFGRPPFDQVTVRSIAPGKVAGDRIDVVVEFLGIDQAGRATPLAYDLEVSTVDWSIVEGEDVSREAS